MQPSARFLRNLRMSFVTQRQGVSEYLLKTNSLKILLAPDASASSVAVFQVVHVGSRHEGAGNTGYSHLLEHMVFKGTPTHNRNLGNSYDQFCKALGDTMNAMTTCDFTAYHCKFPSWALGTYLEYEADRLRNVVLRDEDLASEMPVVVDEFDQGENEPDMVLDMMLRSQAYTQHPYKVDTIGAKSEILQVTAAALKERLYDMYYWPNNVTLIIAGGFDVKEALAHVARCYGDIPPSPRPIPKVHTVEPEQVGERRFEICKPGDAVRIAMGFHVPEAEHEHHYALSALVTILGGTSASRLSRKLIDKGLTSAAYAQMQRTHDAGLFQLYARVTPGKDYKRVERIMLEEIEKLKEKPVSLRELNRLKRLNRNSSLMMRADVENFALALTEAEGVADWQWAFQHDEEFDKVTAEAIQEVARRYLTPLNRTVGYFLPTSNAVQAEASDELQAGDVSDSCEVTPDQASQSQDSETPSDRQSEAPAKMPKQSLAQEAAQAAQIAANEAFILSLADKMTDAITKSKRSLAKQTKPVVLPNGLKLLLMPTSTESALGITLLVNAGTSCAASEDEILPATVCDMLPRGSAKYSKKRIDELTSEWLVNFDFQPDTFYSSLSTLVPPAELPKFLDMLCDALCQPLFAESELAVFKEQESGAFAEAEQSPEQQASIALLQKLYGAESPFYKPSVAASRKKLDALSSADLKQFHQKFWGPTGAVMAVVGKFDPAEMEKLLATKLACWTGGQAPAFPDQPAERATSAARANLQIDGKENIRITIGKPVDVSARSPDYLAAVMANKALGGDTLSSRLGLEIRERRGLTYGINSGFTEKLAAGGPWTVGMTTDRLKVEIALPVIEQIISKFLEEGIGRGELATEKFSLVNQTSLRYDSALSIANGLAVAEYAGLGIGSIDQFAGKVLNLTQQEVDAAARKHFQMQAAVTVVAGNLGE